MQNNVTMTKRHTLDLKVNGVSRRKDVFATYRPVGPTCPASCPFLNQCYATEGRTNLAQVRSAPNSVDFLERFALLPEGAIVRHHVSGDVYQKDGRVDAGYCAEVRAAHESRPDVRGINYTHGWRDMDPAILNTAGLVTNASCESPAEALEALKAGWDVVLVMPRGTGNNVPIGDRAIGIQCPAQRNEGRVDCAKCMLCARSGRKSMGRDIIVLFEEHSNVKVNREKNATILNKGRG